MDSSCFRRLCSLTLILLVWIAIASVLYSSSMGPSFYSTASVLAFALIGGIKTIDGQSTSFSSDVLPSSTTNSIGTATISGKLTTYSVQYTPPASVDDGALLIPNVEDPEAVDAQTVCPGYSASNVQRTAYGFTASLTLAGDACNVYGTDIEDLILTVDYQTSSRLNVNIQPTYIGAQNESWFLLSPELVELPQHGVPTDDGDQSDLQFSWSNDPTFSFTVLRQSTNEVLFTTEGTQLVYENQFIEFVTAMPEGYNLYGLGEHIDPLKIADNFTSTSWAVDAGNPIDSNLYSSHPFYLESRYYEVNSSTGETTLLTGNASADADYVGSSHGVYWRNAHGLEAITKPTSLTWRALGGNIDLYFFSGTTPAEITSQYNSVIGLPAMQQYFTFGYHQCRWGYKNWTELEQVVTNFRNYDIPLENIWTDIDYMFQYRDFENDQNTYPYGPGEIFIAQLAANGQHYIPIVDSALYIPDPDNASDAYPIYSNGHAYDTFLHNADGSEYIGDVWPGYTVFPDWLNPNSTTWWVESVESHYEKIAWSGLWIDMSEASSFCLGSCGTGNLSLNPVHPPFALPGEEGAIEYVYPEGFNITNATEAAAVSSASAADPANQPTSTASGPSTTLSYVRTTPTPGVRNVTLPPYVINNVNGELGVHALQGDAVHYGGAEEYDLHNLNGHRILNATYAAVANAIPGKRPFIIGRSTFAGSGKYAGHWGGDNNSRFGSLYFTISQALQMSLFGIPMFGVDLCGFSGNSDEELCARWMALGSFLPFMRNHNVLSAISQEPYIWESVATATRIGINIRYQLLPYMYTLMHNAHTTGSTVLRALAWEFPNDPTLAAVDQQVLLGPAILVTPVLAQGVDYVNGVFPGLKEGQRWYDWYNHTQVVAEPFANTTLAAPLTHINVHVRGGHVLALQEAKYTTSESRNSSWSVLAALDQNEQATGQVYLDDGESEVQNATLVVDLAVAGGTLYASGQGLYVDGNPLANVTVLGLAARPANVTLNGLGVGFTYDADIGRLNVTGLAGSTAAGAWAGDWTLTWA